MRTPTLTPRAPSRLMLAGLALFALVPAALSCGGSTTGSAAASGGTGGPAATGRLRIGFISTQKDFNGPEGFSYARGAFKAILGKAGISDVEVSAFPNGPPLSEAIKGGSLDVGIYGDTPAMVARAGGLPTRLVIQSTLDLEAFLLTKKDGGPTDVKDLGGRKVGVQKGSYIHRYLLGLLDGAGLKDKVTVSDLATTDAEAALTRGELDAYAAPAPISHLLEAKGFPVIDRIRRDHPDLAGSSVTVVTQAYADANPALVAAWRQARAAAVAEVRAEPQAYYDFQARTQNLPADKLGPKLAEIYPFDAYPTEPLIPRGRTLLEGTKRFLLDQKLVRSDFSIDDWLLP
jgi:sulfonate transport system substrate-binding protein